MNGTILNISRFCRDDGPGIRTTVFMKGCPLSCVWCHNPESQHTRPEILYDAEKCGGCQRCAAVCLEGCHLFEGGRRFDRAACKGCGACAAICPSKALELFGNTISAEAVLAEVQKDAVFYGTSGGGVTVSGGEPLFHPEFTVEILRLCREHGISTAIETSGFAREDVVKSVIAFCDLVLFDIKETDAEKHLLYTGVPLAPILSNLRLLDESGVPFWLRLPIIPGYNDRDAHFEAVRALVGSLRHCRRVQVMPYHVLGAYKYEQLGRPYQCRNITQQDAATIRTYREKAGESSAVLG